jgi:hypothetical protein
MWFSKHREHEVAEEVEKPREEGKRREAEIVALSYIMRVILRPIFQSPYPGTGHLKIPYPDSPFMYPLP